VCNNEKKVTGISTNSAMQHQIPINHAILRPTLERSCHHPSPNSTADPTRLAGMVRSYDDMHSFASVVAGSRLKFIYSQHEIKNKRREKKSAATPTSVST
jgi:hypothetical protein